ncbi:MAG: response regulator [Polyangiaceae bacterium]
MELFDGQVLAGLLVLVVDDEAEARALARVALERRGAVVAEAASAREARDWLRAWIPSLVICDLAMPGEDGLDFVRGLRASRGPERFCKVIALSGMRDEYLRQRSLAAGFDSYVSKSVPVDVLISVLRVAARSRGFDTAPGIDNKE